MSTAAHLHVAMDEQNDCRFDRFRSIWSHTQPGLVYSSPHAIFCTAWLRDSDKLKLNDLKLLAVAIRRRINGHHEVSLKGMHSSVTLGVSFSLWEKVAHASNKSVPKGMKFNFPMKDDKHDSLVFHDAKTFFRNAHGDLWFHIKSDTAIGCQIIFEFIQEKLKELHDGRALHHIFKEVASSRGGEGGKILGCRFSENLNNPADPISIAKHSIIGPEDADHMGGSFVMSQRFVIDWERVNNLSEEQIEDLLGRDLQQEIIPDRHQFTHIKAARLHDENGNTQMILRLGLPFGNAKKDHPSMFKLSEALQKVNDEEGLYFAGYSKSAAILENIMLNQIGSKDRLLSMMNPSDNVGGFFYIPSLDDLLVVDLRSALFNGNFFQSLTNSPDSCDWRCFPGVDWQRTNRHYKDSSKNGLMFYNHQNFLFQMATNIGRSDEARKIFKAPSDRILSLLETSFNLWQDNWYYDRKQMEFAGDIVYYIRKYHATFAKTEFPAPRIPEEIMNKSIISRRAWAIRCALNAYSSHEYGFRGRKLLLKNKRDDDKLHFAPYNVYFCASSIDQSNLPSQFQGHFEKYKDAQVVCGANTYHILPEDIIVGGMNNLSLGEGSYMIHYLNDTNGEREEAYLMNLSEYSGVGHNIPNYEKVLRLGLPGMIAELHEFIANSSDQKKDFYEASLITLLGIKEHCLNYADLAKEMATARKSSHGQIWEYQNLLSIAERMENLTKSRPETFVEAVQLIFTVHSCLHLTGEPCALGRLDQWLMPFYHTTTEDEAQEVIDSLYIKLCDKVQSNRMFMEDHQRFGNLAMNGSSGPYPKGASLNQWIQQVTVGGTLAENDEHVDDVANCKPAYNALTKIFLKSSGRLPLTAPCLSLRTRSDMPKEIAELAAHVILSGGAHPIFLSDEKIIPGMYHSGDKVGGSSAHTWRKKNEETNLWKSEVSWKSAKNYACDGCYEPQFCGENWFALGGFSMLNPLECALNQGRLYAAAGDSFLFGQNNSLNSKPASEIKDFDELKDLFYKHFDLLNRKSFHTVFLTFGNNSKFCPSPMLNTMIDGCLEKGQDFYSGGPKYNLYGPCYTGFANVINSLYAIKAMCFEESTAVTTLPELVMCLLCNWGNNMTEPFFSTLAGSTRSAGIADRFKRLRDVALRLPKYGRGNADIDMFGNEIMTKIVSIAMEALTKPLPKTEAMMKDFATQYGQVLPFGFQLQPGSGTFENCVAFGGWNGASADGRLNGTAIADDMAPNPSPMDLPVDHQIAGFAASLKSFSGTGTAGLCNGAATDFNIREQHPAEKITEVIELFAKGEGSNILTITVADPSTFDGAKCFPSQFDLVRVRMGGWSNFFSAIFPIIQEEHKRRPISVPDDEIPSPASASANISRCPFHQQSKKRKTEHET